MSNLNLIVKYTVSVVFVLECSCRWLFLFSVYTKSAILFQSAVAADYSEYIYLQCTLHQPSCVYPSRSLRKRIKTNNLNKMIILYFFFCKLLKFVLTNLLKCFKKISRFKCTFVYISGYKDSLGGVTFLQMAREARRNVFYTPPPLEIYYDVYQIIGFSWVWFEFSTHFRH